MCGEKQKRKLCLEDFLGSPPHVRGKVRRHRNDYLSVRITPACAGKSFLILDMNRFPKDHPRLCGEKGLWQCSQISIPGSPPHVRGKGEHKRKSTRGNRITPPVGWMDCPPVSPGGGSEVPEALLEPGVGAGLTGSPW